MDRILDLQMMDDSSENEGDLFLCSTCSGDGCQAETCGETCGGTSDLDN